ncbi:MAG: P-II family nitrogen regulator [Deltaproteobacteria bacterium]|jgi:nitrogen regulatory protein PII 1|nr:P-II family nitrogen regulator [Deltaproteobacteria bacterium]MCL5879914.1 P-II family nitrogen regulator [Deltaproteobacteria bacterium]MDA8304315.1 P-II family nitrogen regulator [Deltaproteobacteria bacterium]
MEMVRAIIRPEKEKDVLKALEENGFVSVTKMHVFGRGKQKGIKVGEVVYDELPKLELMIVVKKEDAERVCDIIQENAVTGHIGDGKIFVVPVSKAYTVRTGAEGL